MFVNIIGVALASFALVQASLSDKIVYTGRFDFSNGYPVADWSGSRLTFFVEGSDGTAEVHMPVSMGGEIESFNYYVGIEVNCNLIGKYNISPSTPALEFSFDTELGSTYEVSVIKLTEASTGAMAFNGFKVNHANLLDPKGISRCHDGALKMLVVGDSITAAYGVDGEYPCSFSPDTENILESYATLVAANIGAEVHTVAWSGKGVVRNYGDENTTSPDPMPTFYNRTLGISGDPALFWNPSTVEFAPDLVLVTLGSNDYSTEPHPSDADFVAGYSALVGQIRQDYPLALVASVCEPTPGLHECENEQEVAESMGIGFIAVPDDIYVEPEGCDYHPSVQGQRNIADIVTPAVLDLLMKHR